MIIKSMSRKVPSFGQLIDYMSDIDKADEKYNIYQNLYSRKNEDVEQEFKQNARTMFKRKNGVYLYHEILSITKTQNLEDKVQKEILRSVAYEYASKRAEHNLVFATLHDDHDEHLHYHFIISSNALGESKKTRMSKAQFDKFKKNLESRTLKKYPELEQIIKPYAKDEVNTFAELFADLVLTLESSPRDVLGELYMELKLGNKNAGQFFTPPHISELMAEVVYGDELKDIDQPFITLLEPTCGAGGMVLAFVKTMISHGHNPADKLWVQCTDIDRLAALMCYVQLSLWYVPAQVIVGNSLTLETREVFYTPAHYMGLWDMRLNLRKSENLITQHRQAQDETDKPKIDESKLPDTNIIDIGKSADIQLGFDF